jgi:4-hydroxy-tetrahydrodipicolinate reductase
MKLAIVGYGKMGRLIEQLAPEYGFTIHARVILNWRRARMRRWSLRFRMRWPGMSKSLLPWECRWRSGRPVGRGRWTGCGEAAKLLADESQYGAWAWEIHHHTKKDAPSGTLIKLVEEMKKGGYTRNIDVSSNRTGAHPGTHEIGFDSAADTITLRHAARSREGFARGALKAAQWIVGKKGVFEFSEILFQR